MKLYSFAVIDVLFMNEYVNLMKHVREKERERG